MIEQFVRPSTSFVNSAGLRIGIVIARNNLRNIGSIFGHAYELLTKTGVARENIHVVSVPHSYDLVHVAKSMVGDNAYDVIVCLGNVPGGAACLNLPIEDIATQGFQWVAFYAGTPVVFCVTRDQEQNDAELMKRGAECAQTALRLARSF